MNNLTTIMAARTKKLDRVYLDRIATRLRPIIAERFAGNVTAAAKEMGVSQATLHAIMAGKDRGVGIVVLLAIRDYLRDVTLDELLGLTPPEMVRVSSVEAKIDRMLSLAERIGSAAPPVALLPPAPSPSRKRR